MREEGLAQDRRAISNQMAECTASVCNTCGTQSTTECVRISPPPSVQRLQSADLRPVPHILVRLYKPVTTPITVLRMPSFWAQFKETKEWKHTKPVQRLTFTCWDVKCRMTERSELSRRHVWHFVYLSVSVSTAVLSKRKDRFSRILEWTWLVVKKCIAVLNLRYSNIASRWQLWQDDRLLTV